MIIWIATVFHVAICVALVAAVLMQAGKGAGLAGVFGSSGGGQQMFGSRGAGSFLTKATTVLAIVFMLSSIALFALNAGSRAVSMVAEDLPMEEEVPHPAEGSLPNPADAPAMPAPIEEAPTPDSAP